VSVRRPTSGKVVSAGPGKLDSFSKLIPMKYKVGDNVMFSNFAGHAMDFPDPEGRQVPSPDGNGYVDAKIVLHVLHEGEILASVRGHLEMRRVSNQREALGI